MTDPRVQVVGGAAVLTFRFGSRSGAEEHRWNFTEVYRRAQSGEWRIIQTHWSQPLTRVLGVEAIQRIRC